MGCEGLSVHWARPALADFVEIQQYIASENPVAANVEILRLWHGRKNWRTV
jgi:plasmid stabilization system protein ParE